MSDILSLDAAGCYGEGQYWGTMSRFIHLGAQKKKKKAAISNSNQYIKDPALEHQIVGELLEIYLGQRGKHHILCLTLEQRRAVFQVP